MTGAVKSRRQGVTMYSRTVGSETVGNVVGSSLTPPEAIDERPAVGLPPGL